MGHTPNQPALQRFLCPQTILRPFQPLHYIPTGCGQCAIARKAPNVGLSKGLLVTMKSTRRGCRGRSKTESKFGSFVTAPPSIAPVTPSFVPMSQRPPGGPKDIFTTIQQVPAQRRRTSMDTRVLLATKGDPNRFCAGRNFVDTRRPVRNVLESGHNAPG